MVRLGRCLVWVALTGTLVPNVAAATPTGQEFLNNCRSEDNVLHGVCLGYVSGVIDSAPVYAYLHDSDPSFCTPEGVTAGQARAVVIKFLEDHPADLHLGAETLVVGAAITAWPCESPEAPRSPKKEDE